MFVGVSPAPPLVKILVMRKRLTERHRRRAGVTLEQVALGKLMMGHGVRVSSATPLRMVPCIRRFGAYCR